MNLSDKQLKEMENIKKEIDKARAYDNFKDYILETNSFLVSRKNPEKYYEENKEYYEGFKKYWERARKGIVLSSAGKSTLKALAKKEIIEIVEFEEYRNNGVIDWVKLKNY